MLVILADSSYFYPINLISNSKQMKNRLYTYLAGWIFLWLPALLLAQAIDGPTALFLMHSSGNHVAKDAQGGAVLEAADAPSPQKLTFIPDGNGYYALQSADGQGYLSLTGQWNTSFTTDPSSAKALYAIENSGEFFVKLRCKYNNKYLGTDGTTASSAVYSDKDGTDTRHLWYLTTDVHQAPPADTSVYVINPAATRQQFEGWGISLCWWANMCGKWSDEKIDELVDWLVSPDGLDYRIFRYNIGGGDDPQNRNCTPHHMGSGKGLRAEMEGFKDSPDGEYIWSRDAAQRKIMLKIKERRPDAIFEAFSNSCPYYMTYSGCCAGHTDASADNLKPEYYEAFAHYLVDVCRHYKEEYGIEFRTLSPFNEPMTSYWGSNGGQEGCHFDIASQVAFLKVLHPILKASGLNTVISASEETDAAQSVRDFEGYQSRRSAAPRRTMEHTHLLGHHTGTQPNQRALQGTGHPSMDERSRQRRKRYCRKPEPGTKTDGRHTLHYACGVGGLAIRGGGQRPMVSGARRLHETDLPQGEELFHPPTLQ